MMFGGFFMINDEFNEEFNDDMELIFLYQEEFREYKKGFSLGKIEVLDAIYNEIIPDIDQSLENDYWFNCGYMDGFNYYYDQYMQLGCLSLEEILYIESADIFWKHFLKRVIEYNSQVESEDKVSGFALILK